MLDLFREYLMLHELSTEESNKSRFYDYWISKNQLVFGREFNGSLEITYLLSGNQLLIPYPWVDITREFSDMYGNRIKNLGEENFFTIMFDVCELKPIVLERLGSLVSIGTKEIRGLVMDTLEKDIPGFTFKSLEFEVEI